jgi:hypothetical protein
MGHFERRLDLVPGVVRPAPISADAFFAALIAKLDRDTERIRSATVIAKAIADNREALIVPTPPRPLNLPNLAGVAPAFAKLRHGIEARAQKLLARVEGTDARADDVFAKADAKLDAHEHGLKAIDGFLDDLDAVVGNGAPAGSAGSSTDSSGT